jgi:hypothetical protein
MQSDFEAVAGSRRHGSYPRDKAAVGGKAIGYLTLRSVRGGRRCAQSHHPRQPDDVHLTPESESFGQFCLIL